MRSFFISVILAFSVAMAHGQTVASMPVVSQQALVTRYCASCHNDKLKSGGFSWARVNLTRVDSNAEQTEKVILKLRAGMMPPAGAPRPDADTIRSFASALENGIDQVARTHPNPGIGPALHRLNRTEYRNSIRDLLDLDVDVASLLPPDDSSHGFDNMADVLTVSPALMEGYIRAAGKISRQAVGDPNVGPTEKTYHIPRVINQTRHVEDTPIGTRGGISVIHNFPADGEYTFKVAFYDSLDGPLYGKNQGKSQQIEFSVNGARVAVLNINPNMKLTDYPQTPPIKIKAGPQRISAAFIQKFEGPVEDIVSPPELSLVDLNNADMPGMTSLPHLREFSVSGPKNVTGVSDTPSRAKIFTCRPAADVDEIRCAKRIVLALSRQAFRRPSTESDAERLLSYYQQGRNGPGNDAGKDGGFDAGIRTALQAIIADPEFVFRFERTPPNIAAGSNFRVSDLELASRLSYFLWSSAPDDELIAQASQGKLKDPAALQQQVRRMMADPKSQALAANFAGQWLHLQNLKDVQPDAFLFPNFDRNLVDSMRRETELLFSSIMREDRNVLDLLSAKYTFVDELLAKQYGIPNVSGSRFRRVEIRDPNRIGLLGQASILTLTSVSNRTSPVARGKWVMEVLLGSPPPPPLPDVPALKENSESAKALSVRERLEEHRKNPVCAACHKMMDPIGFSLENFDAVGAWRIKDSGFPVDASGKMYDGTKLDGPVSLRQAILSHSDAFIGTFSQNLLAYGLGRVVDYRDMPAVRAVEKDASMAGNRFSAFVLSIVRSAPFQMRRAEENESSVGDEAHH